MNSACNIWNVLAAEYAVLPRPAYLTQTPAAYLPVAKLLIIDKPP